MHAIAPVLVSALAWLPAYPDDVRACSPCPTYEISPLLVAASNLSWSGSYRHDSRDFLDFDAGKKPTGSGLERIAGKKPTGSGLEHIDGKEPTGSGLERIVLDDELEAPDAAVTSCADKTTSGFGNLKTNTPYKCAQVKNMCGHTTYGTKLKANCPKTCGACSRPTFPKAVPTAPSKGRTPVAPTKEPDATDKHPLAELPQDIRDAEQGEGDWEEGSEEEVEWGKGKANDECLRAHGAPHTQLGVRRYGLGAEDDWCSRGIMLSDGRRVTSRMVALRECQLEKGRSP